MTEALNPATGAVLDRLAAALGQGGVRPPEPRDLEEPRGRFLGRAGAVLRPRSAEEVSAVLRICADARVGVVPRAGGTGLVGGGTLGDESLPVLLSLERMNRIRALDLTDNVLVAEAGVVLADVQAAAREAGRLFPLSLASEGSARIGGLLATNAGGVHVLRYGNARDLCLGVEAVMADGRILRGLSRLVKDNMGYDLRHLLIGSEGTLGIVTAASLKMVPLPGETVTAWVQVASPQAALDLLRRLRDRLGGAVSAFELIHAQGLDFLREVLPQVAIPPGEASAWTVLVEADETAGSGLEPRLEAALAAALETGGVRDALIAQSAQQRGAFWTVRESLPVANRMIGSVSSHDISVPPSRLTQFLDRAGPILAGLDPSLRINCFGHLGDGNLHYNVFPARGRSRADYEPLRPGIKAAIHDLVHSLDGSVGAEHGVGRVKVDDLERYGDPGKLAVMRAIKTALDPAGILNPGAVLTA